MAAKPFTLSPSTITLLVAAAQAEDLRLEELTEHISKEWMAQRRAKRVPRTAAQKAATAKKAAKTRAENAAREAAWKAKLEEQKAADAARRDSLHLPYHVTEGQVAPSPAYYEPAGQHVWGPDGFSTQRYRLRNGYCHSTFTKAYRDSIIRGVIVTGWCRR